MSKSITQDLLFRQSIVAYAIKYSITQAAIRYKKCKSFVFYWLKKYDGTRDSLIKKSTKPHSNPHAHTAEELKWIADYKRRMPNSSLIDVWVSITRNKGYMFDNPTKQNNFCCIWLLTKAGNKDII